MDTWTTWLRLHIPRLLAKESASAVIMIGTLTGAGLAAPALSAAQSGPAQLPTLRLPAQSVPSIVAPCQTIAVGNGNTICMGHFLRGRHAGYGWGGWRHRHHDFGNGGWGAWLAQPAPPATAIAGTGGSTVSTATR